MAAPTPPTQPKSWPANPTTCRRQSCGRRASARPAERHHSHMPWKLWIRAGEILVTAVLAISLIAAWRAGRNDRANLAAELATAKQSLAQADDRQHTRDSQLLQTLATLAADKRNVTTPAQIIRE